MQVFIYKKTFKQRNSIVGNFRYSTRDGCIKEFIVIKKIFEQFSKKLVKKFDKKFDKENRQR